MFGFTKRKIILLLIIVLVYSFFERQDLDYSAIGKDKVQKSVSQINENVDVDKIKEQVIKSYDEVQKLIAEADSDRELSTKFREEKLFLKKQLEKLKNEKIIDVSKSYRDKILNLELSIDNLSLDKEHLEKNKAELKKIIKELKETLELREKEIKKSVEKE